MQRPQPRRATSAAHHESAGPRDSRGQLRSLPQLYADCEVLLTRPRDVPAARLTGSRGAGIDLHTRALELRAEMVAWLASWCELVRSEHGRMPDPGRDVARMCRFLESRIDWLLRHPAAEDFTRELTELFGSVWRFTREPEPVRLELGECTRPDCGRPVAALVGADGETASRVPKVACEGGHSWAVTDWLVLASELVR